MDGTETLTLTAATASGRPSMPVREDCWSEDASYTLIEAWGERYLELNRGNLRQKHWQEVADAVNDRHGAIKKARRTDVQCKNRIDTLKKKYKLEKARVLASGGTFISRWPFYNQLDALIGTSVQSKRSHSHSQHQHQHQHHQQPVPLALSLPYRKTNHSLPHALVVPVAARSVREKRSPPAPPPPPPPHPHPHVDDSFFRRNYSAIAAAAAADPADSGSSRSSTESRRREEGEVDGFKELAQAISRFAEIYERVEGTKQRQMIELEKERMEFMKSLEFQRMQLFMDSQVQLEKIKRAKRASASDIYD